MDVISRTLDSVVSVVGQASQRTLYYRRHLILESLLSDPNKAKTMLNDWKCALVDNTSKDVFGNKFEEEICRSSKIKPSQKMYLKVLHQAINPFTGVPCSVVVTWGVATEDLLLTSKVSTSLKVRDLFLPPAENLPALQDFSRFTC